MNLDLVENIANAVLYEGYMLYPYRASSVKNRQRFNWGALAPKAYSDAQNGTEAWEMRTECLANGSEDTELNIRVRFLHLTNREIGKVVEPSELIPDDFDFVPSIEVDGTLYQAWQEAVEREVMLPAVDLAAPADAEFPFTFPESRNIDPIYNSENRIAGLIIRTQREVKGTVRLSIADSGSDLLKKITVLIQNTTRFENAELSDREMALLSSIVSTHAIISLERGEFVSLLDPPAEFVEAAAKCENKGVFPVLAGPEGSQDCMLSSPIILYDHPQIAAESAGDLFDGTEIDEILTLRIMTLTDEEKREVRATDDRTRAILERTEMMPDEQLQKMHGALRGLERSKRANHG